MDFMVSFHITIKEYDSIWDIDDRLMKLDNFIPINIIYPLKKLSEIYISEIVILHMISSSIVSERDPRLTSIFRESLHKVMGTKLKLSIAYHL